MFVCSYGTLSKIKVQTWKFFKLDFYFNSLAMIFEEINYLSFIDFFKFTKHKIITVTSPEAE